MTQYEKIGVNATKLNVNKESCLDMCMAYKDAKGCAEVRNENSSKFDCYVFTENVTKGDGGNVTSSCWILSKCRGMEQLILLR